MASYQSVSEQIESAYRTQEMVSAHFNSAKLKKVPKKHQLPNGHYTIEFIMSVHQQLILDNVEHSTIHSTTPDEFSASKLTLSESQAIQNYKKYAKIKIHDLVVGVVNRDKILYAKTIVDEVEVASVHTVIEDEFGGACKLCIYNLSSEKRGRLKSGVELAIINPYYKKAWDRMNMMRVDNPAEIIFFQKPKSPSTIPLTPMQHKDEGNMLFKEERYSDAIREYTMAINGDEDEPTYLSNRALCYIKLGQFELALADADQANAINPKEPKFRYRQAMSLSGLGKHKQAISIIKDLIKETGDTKNLYEFKGKLNQENIYLNQQHGIFDFREIEDLAIARDHIQIADFIGPIELGKSSVKGCAERGLFATRDIKKGEVIHVSKAAVFLGDFKMDCSNIIEVNVDAMKANAPPFRILGTKLIDKMNTSSLFATRVLNVIEDANSKSYPFYTNIDLYTEKGFELIQNLDPPKFSMEQIRHITTKRSHASVLNGSNNSTSSLAMYGDLVSGRNTYGFWFIQSFLNHSCLGNVVGIIKGEISVLKALKNVKEGEELLFSKFDASFSMTLEDRKNSLQLVHGFECHCQLCEFESQEEIRPILKRVRKLAKQIHKFVDQYACRTDPILRSMVPIHQFRNYATRGIELAELLELDPFRFCGSLWDAFIDLTYVWILDEAELLSFYQKIEKYLCELEAYHQYRYWRSYQDYCQYTLGDFHPLSLQVTKRFNEFDKIFEWK